MGKLIVHIGAHKTGSTSIQKFMFDYRKYFEERYDLFYPVRGLTRPKGSLWGQHFLTWYYTPKENVVSREALDASFAEFLAFLEAHPGRNVLVSSEDFVWNHRVPEFLQKMREYFDEIEVLIYVRNQVDAAVSLFQTGVVNGGYAGTFEEWFSRAYRLFDYGGIIKEWEENGCRITVKPFRRETFAGKDVIVDFVMTLGEMIQRRIPMPEDYHPENVRSNVTVPDFITKMIHHYNGDDEARRKVVPHLRELGTRLILADREIPTMGFLPLKTKQEIRQRYLESNRRLCEQYLGAEHLEWLNREIDEEEALYAQRFGYAGSQLAELAKYTIRTMEKLGKAP